MARRRGCDAERGARAAIDARARRADAPFEGVVARDVAAALPDGATLVVASSLPVRALEWCMAPRDGLRVLANRGANGIDGFVSTVVGVAARARRSDVVGLCGDLCFLHDTNGLLGARSAPATFVVLDNDGGGIFSFLPQARPARVRTLFGTPHGLDLVAVARAHGVHAPSASTISATLDDAFAAGEHARARRSRRPRRRASSATASSGPPSRPRCGRASSGPDERAQHRLQLGLRLGPLRARLGSGDDAGTRVEPRASRRRSRAQRSATTNSPSPSASTHPHGTGVATAVVAFERADQRARAAARPATDRRASGAALARGRAPRRRRRRAGRVIVVARCVTVGEARPRPGRRSAPTRSTSSRARAAIASTTMRCSRASFAEASSAAGSSPVPAIGRDDDVAAVPAHEELRARADEAVVGVDACTRVACARSVSSTSTTSNGASASMSTSRASTTFSISPASIAASACSSQLAPLVGARRRRSHRELRRPAPCGDVQRVR